MKAESEPRSRRRIGTKTRIAAGVAAITLTVSGYSYEHPDKASDTSRALFGARATAQIEHIVQSVEDKYKQLKYSVDHKIPKPLEHLHQNPVAYNSEPTSENTQDFPPETIIDIQPPSPEPPKPAPLVLPETKHLIPNETHGEGVWSFDGVPHNTPNDIMMAWTTFHPDSKRPYATAGVLLMDKRRIKLNIVAGTEEPGGGRGPGTIPNQDRANLLVAWNGGFKFINGGYGMYADGKFYRPLSNGLATIVTKRDGSIEIGQWGQDLLWSADIVAARQNAIPLIHHGEISSRTNDNSNWGYDLTSSSITWRSGIGVTMNGDILLVAGNDLSAATLAQSMWAAGAVEAMQLDINRTFVTISMFFPRADGRGLRGESFINADGDINRFLSTNSRDFMYVTLEESKFKP